MNHGFPQTPPMQDLELLDFTSASLPERKDVFAVLRHILDTDLPQVIKITQFCQKVAELRLYLDWIVTDPEIHARFINALCPSCPTAQKEPIGRTVIQAAKGFAESSSVLLEGGWARKFDLIDRAGAHQLSGRVKALVASLCVAGSTDREVDPNAAATQVIEVLKAARRLGADVEEMVSDKNEELRKLIRELHTKLSDTDPDQERAAYRRGLADLGIL